MRNNLCKLYDFRAIDNVDNCHKSNTGSKVSLNSKSNHPMRVIPNLALVNLATWSLKSTLYLVVILATVCRIPFAAIRLLKFHQETEKRKARDIVWSSSRSSKMFYFTSLPKELQLHILAFVDNQSLGRVSATTSSVYHLARDQFLWSKKLAIEYPDTSLCFSKRIEKSHTISMAFYENFQTSLGKNLASPFPVKVESPAYALFRIRYINNARCQGARKRYHATADSIHSILRQEADMGMESIATFLCLPFKAIGYSTIPVHYLCQNRNLSLQNSYHSCLRLFVMDLSRLSSRFFEFKKMHIFGLVNVMCAALWILDEIARACANINCLMMKLVTCQTFFKPLDFIWKLFWIPIMASFHLQLILIPWSLTAPNKFLYPFSLIESLSSLGFQASLTYRLALQILWVPVICSIEELSFEFASQNLRITGIAKWGLFFLKLFTMSLQSLIGIIAYLVMISVSLLHSHLN